MKLTTDNILKAMKALDRQEVDDSPILIPDFKYDIFVEEGLIHPDNPMYVRIDSQKRLN